MDSEEQEILRSNLKQSEKISIDSFFGSPIGGLANRALTQSNTNLKATAINRNLITALQLSFESLKSQVQQITNYILIDKQERSQIVKQRELEAFQREDAIQKGIIGQSRGLEDDQPFFPENRFSQGLTAGMLSIGEPKGVAKFQQDVLGVEAEGSRSFFFGGLVPGFGNADTVNAKLTPGEFVVPKNTVENFSPNFFEGLTASKPETNSYSSSIKYSTRGNTKTGEIEIDPSSLESGVPIEAAQQDYYMGNIKKLQFQIRNKKRQFGDDYDTSYMEGQLKKFNDKYNSTLEYGGIDYTNIGKNEKKKENKGLFGAIGGTIDAATGNLTDFDKRGGKPFGLMRGITGSIDAMTGGLTDLDRRGGKPFGLMRGITGIGDAMTGNKFDLDRRGKNMTEGFSTYPSGELEDTQLQNKKNQLPMETTVNPDGSISSKGSGTFIGGEIVKPGQPLSEKQKAGMTMGIQMGNTYSPEQMKLYKESGGTISSTDIKPAESVNQDNVKVAPSESIKESSQGLMTPPPPPQSETIELPPQTQGDTGGGGGGGGAAPPFKPSRPNHDELTGTDSPLIFIEVISNPFLSIP